MSPIGPFLLIIAFFVVIMFDQLPDYIMASYGNYLALGMVAIFAAVLYFVLKGR